MCLARITERLTPEPDVTRAWKVVIRDSGGIRGLSMGRKLATGKWLKARRVTLHLPASLGGDYDAGFHCYIKQSDADAIAQAFGPECQVIEVLVRYVHTRGLEYYQVRPREWTEVEVLVAKELFVPPDSQTETKIGESHDSQQRT